MFDDELFRKQELSPKRFCWKQLRVYNSEVELRMTIIIKICMTVTFS